MEDLSEMSHVVRSRARAAIAKVSVPVLTGMPMCDACARKKIVFISRSEIIRDHSPAIVTCGPMTGKERVALSVCNIYTMLHDVS